MADVFIIHSHLDEDWVKGVLLAGMAALSVQRQGRPQLGEFVSTFLADGVADAKVVVIVVGDTAWADAWQGYATALASRQKVMEGRCVVSVQRGERPFQPKGIAPPGTVEEVLAFVHEQVEKRPKELDGPACPYAGLGTRLSVTTWAGYERQRDGLVDRLAGTHGQQVAVEVVVGLSGVGKSAMLHAGLRPKMEAAGWTVNIVDLATEPDWRCETMPQGWLAPRALLVIDAVEQWCDGSTRSESILAGLAEVLNAAPGGALVLSLRWEFLEALRKSAMNHVAWVEPVVLNGLSGEQLACAIRKPAESVGVFVDPVLWDHKTARFIPWTALGDRRVEDVLAARGNRVLSSFGDDAAIAEQILIRLVHVEDGLAGVRKSRSREELLRTFEPDVLDRCIGVLSRERLIVSQADSAGKTSRVTLSHERLVAAWGGLNGRVETSKHALRDLDRLEQRAVLWSEGNGALLDLKECRRARRELGNARDVGLMIPRVVQDWVSRSWMGAVLGRAAVAAVSIVAVAAIAVIVQQSDLPTELAHVQSEQLATRVLDGAERALEDELPSVALSILADNPLPANSRWIELGNEAMQHPVDDWILAGHELAAAHAPSGRFATASHGELFVHRLTNPYDSRPVGLVTPINDVIRRQMAGQLTGIPDATRMGGHVIHGRGNSVRIHPSRNSLAYFDGQGALQMRRFGTDGRVSDSGTYEVPDACDRLVETASELMAVGWGCCRLLSGPAPISCEPALLGKVVSEEVYFDMEYGVFRGLETNVELSDSGSHKDYATARVWPLDGGDSAMIWSHRRLGIWGGPADSVQAVLADGIAADAVEPTPSGWLVRGNSLTHYARDLASSVHLGKIQGEATPSGDLALPWNGGFFVKVGRRRQVYWDGSLPRIGRPRYESLMLPEMGRREVVAAMGTSALWRSITPGAHELTGSLSSPQCPPGVVGWLNEGRRSSLRWRAGAGDLLDSQHPRADRIPSANHCVMGKPGVAPIVGNVGSTNQKPHLQILYETTGSGGRSSTIWTPNVEWALAESGPLSDRIAAAGFGSAYVRGPDGIRRYSEDGITPLSVHFSAFGLLQITPAIGGRVGIHRGSEARIFGRDGGLVSPFIEAHHLRSMAGSTGRYWVYRSHGTTHAFDVERQESFRIDPQHFGRVEGQTDELAAIAAAPGTDRLAIADEDGVVVVGEHRDGQFVPSLTFQVEPTFQDELSFDGPNRLTTSGNDGVVRQWWLDSESLHAAMLQAKPPCVPEQLRLDYLGESQQEASAAWQACIADWQPR